MGANGHMGVMRAIEVYCVLVILLFVTKNSYYDAAYWVSSIQMIAMAVTLWLLWNKKRHAREIILGIVGAFMVLDLVVQIATGTFTFGTYVASAFLPACMLVYFATSKRAKAVLNQPFETKSRQELLAEDEKLWNLKSPLKPNNSNAKRLIAALSSSGGAALFARASLVLCPFVSIVLIRVSFA